VVQQQTKCIVPFNCSQLVQIVAQKRARAATVERASTPARAYDCGKQVLPPPSWPFTFLNLPPEILTMILTTGPGRVVLSVCRGVALCFCECDVSLPTDYLQSGVLSLVICCVSAVVFLLASM
jgi:hypothetical protein